MVITKNEGPKGLKKKIMGRQEKQKIPIKVRK